MLENEKEEILDEIDEVEDTQEEVVEDKHEKFLRLSSGRIQNAEKYISALGNLANKSSYSYSAEEVEKMFSYLQEALDEAKAKFEASEKKTKKFVW